MKTPVLAVTAPEEAAKSIPMIGNPDQRNNVIEQVASQWLNRDRAAAAAWLAQTDLPADRKQQLLAQTTLPAAPQQPLLNTR